MSVPVIAFFNNKGGVGKTTLVQHLSWMYSDRGLRVVTADLDPQCNLTSAFLDEDRLEQIFSDGGQPETIFDSLQPLRRGVGDVTPPKLEPITARLALIVGDMGLSTFEDQLSEVWPKCLDRDERAFRVTSSLWRVLQEALRTIERTSFWSIWAQTSARSTGLLSSLQITLLFRLARTCSLFKA